MSNNNARYDARQKDNCVEIFYDYGVSDVFFWRGLDALDTDYTILLDEGLATEATYTVGSGITLDSGTNSILWAIDTSALTKKTYSGTLKSTSQVSGVYFYCNIILYLE